MNQPPRRPTLRSRVTVVVALIALVVVALMSVVTGLRQGFDPMVFALRVVAGAAVSLGVGFVVARMVGRPLDAIVESLDESCDVRIGADRMAEISRSAPHELMQLANAVGVLLERAATRAAAVEKQSLELLDVNTALHAERRKLLRLERQRQAADLVLEAAVRVLPDALVILDPNLNVRVWNQGAQTLFKLDAEKAIGKDFVTNFLAVGPDTEAPHMCHGDDELSCVETRAVRGDGTELPVQLTLVPVPTPRGIYHAITARDLARARQEEAEERQAQKLEAVGRLASGVAHEINTPIQFVGDSVYFARDACADLCGLVATYRAAIADHAPSTIQQQLAHAEEEADLAYLTEELPASFTRTLDGVQRVATIVRALKEFAHPETQNKTVADLNRAIASTLTVASSQVKYVAEIETDFGDLPPIACHVSELNQVFLNLVVNAAHAIQDVRGPSPPERGKIRVVTRSDHDHVAISISDDGCGIPETIRQRIFEPFFTTKEVGRGTGQGLAIARNVVVEKHGGSITFDSRSGLGTTFRIRLPVA